MPKNPQEMDEAELEAFCRSSPGAYKADFQQERLRREQKKRLDSLIEGQTSAQRSLDRIHRIDWWILVVGVVAAIAGIVAAVAAVLLLTRA